jgi:hypothetical protein
VSGFSVSADLLLRENCHDHKLLISGRKLQKGGRMIKYVHKIFMKSARQNATKKGMPVSRTFLHHDYQFVS